MTGFYVPPEVCCRLLLPAVGTSAGCSSPPPSGSMDGGEGERQASGSPAVAVGPVQCTSCLMALAAVVRGARKDQLHLYLQVHIRTLYMYMYVAALYIRNSSVTLHLFEQ